MRKLFLPFFFFFLIAILGVQSLHAQNILILSKRKNGKPVKFFEVGDKITFVLKGSEARETGIVTNIVTTGFHTNGRLVTFESLAMVAETNKGLKMGLGMAGAVGGTVVLLISQYLPLSILAVTLAGTGVIQTFIYGIRLIVHNRYNLETKWKLDARNIPSE